MMRIDVFCVFWYKSTILDIKEEYITPNRIDKMFLIGFRIYSKNGTKSDENGEFEGLGSEFDEWISINSPRIMPFNSRTHPELLYDSI